MKLVRELSKTLNNYFILIVLFIFYFPVIGIAFVLFKIFSKHKNTNSYWIAPKNPQYDKKYFESPF